MKQALQLSIINGLFGLGFILLTIMSYVTYQQFQKLDNANAWTTHTYKVIEKANLILLSVVDEDARLQNSMLAKDQAIIQHLEKLTLDTMYEIRFLTADNLNQQKQLDKLEPLVKEKNALLEKALKSTSPQLILMTKEQTEKIKLVLKSIQAEELKLLALRSATSHRKLEATNWLIVGLIASGYFLLTLTFFLINHQNNRLKILQRRETDLENRYAKIINSSMDLIAAVDTNLNFIAFNKAYEKKFQQLFGVKIKVGMSLRKALDNHGDRDNLIRTWEQALSGKEYSVALLLGENTKEEYCYEVTFGAIRDENNNIIAASHIMHDITERRKLENLKADFVSTVSHELRTPLTSIRGSLSLALNDSFIKENDKALNLLSIASSNCDRLILLINDLLDIEQLEKAAMRFYLKSIDINDIVKEAVLANADYGDKFSVKINLTSSPEKLFVLADPERLRQVLDNFISNAVKFTLPGGEINVVVTSFNQTVRVAVEDRGEGVPEKFHQSIFQKFSQADSSTTRKHGGTGLGLSICKAIIEKHKGKIGFISQPYKETVFYFELPLEK